MQMEKKEDFENLIQQQIEDYKKDPRSQEVIQEALEALKFFVVEDRIGEFKEFLKVFCYSNKVPEREWRVWLDYLMGLEMNPERFGVILELSLLAVKADYYPKIALSLMDFLLTGLQGTVMDYPEVKKIIEEVVLPEYAKDYFISKQIFAIYQSIVAEKLKDKPDKMRTKALSMLEKRSLGYLHQDFEKKFEESGNDNIGCLKRFEDLKQLNSDIQQDLEYTLGTYNDEQAAGYDSRKSVEFFSSILLKNKDQNFILFAFESLTSLKAFTFDQESKEKLWIHLLSYLNNQEAIKQGSYLHRKYLTRAAQQNPSSIEINRQLIISSNTSIESLDDILAGINQRLFLHNKPVLFKLYSIYFEATLNLMIRNLRKIEGETTQELAVEETVEYLKNLVEYFGTIIQGFLDASKDRGSSSYQARKTFTSILSNFLRFLICLDIDESEYVMENMEKIVKVGGNNPKNWIFYLEFLGKKVLFGELKKMEKVYWRALRFCSGDVFSIYLYMKDFIKIFGEKKITKFEDEFLIWVRSGLKEQSGGPKRKDFDQLLIKLENREERKHKVDTIIQNIAGDSNLGKRDNPFKESEEHKKTLFVSNLPIGFTQADILENLTITSTIDDIRIINRKSNDSSIAYIDFDSKEAALEAKNELNRRILHGKKIYAEISKPPTSKDNTNTLFVNNLPFGLSEEDLIEGLKIDREGLVEIRLKKAYGFVKYKDEDTMKKELKRLGRFVLRGRRLIVKNAAKGPGKRKENGGKVDIKGTRLGSERGSKGKEVQKGQERGVAVDQVVKKKKKKSNKDFQKLFGL